MYEYHEIVIEMMIERRFERDLHAISLFFDWVQSNLCNWIIQCVFVTTTRFLHRWISLVERYRYQITYINHLRSHLLMIVELKHKHKSDLNIKTWCMQSIVRNWIIFCAFVTRTSFLHDWILFIENYTYHVLHIKLILWISCLWVSWMFIYEFLCFIYEFIEWKLKF